MIRACRKSSSHLLRLSCRHDIKIFGLCAQRKVTNAATHDIAEVTHLVELLDDPQGVVTDQRLGDLKRHLMLLRLFPPSRHLHLVRAPTVLSGRLGWCGFCRDRFGLFGLLLERLRRRRLRGSRLRLGLGNRLFFVAHLTLMSAPNAPQSM